MKEFFDAPQVGFLAILISLIMSAALGDLVDRYLARPRVRPILLLRMYRLARQNYAPADAWRLCRLIEYCTRPVVESPRDER